MHDSFNVTIRFSFAYEVELDFSDLTSVYLRPLFLDPNDLELHLADPVSPFTGIVQARCRGSSDWGAVCSGDLWDNRDAEVVCRHLGFSFVSETKDLYVSTLDPATVPSRVIISEFGCFGNESDILECQIGLVRTTCVVVPRISCGKGRPILQFGLLY